MPCFRLSLFQIPSLVSLQTTGKTVNNKILTTLGNIYYAYNYKKTKAALSDTLNRNGLSLLFKNNGTLQKRHVRNVLPEIDKYVSHTKCPFKMDAIP